VLEREKIGIANWERTQTKNNSHGKGTTCETMMGKEEGKKELTPATLIIYNNAHFLFLSPRRETKKEKFSPVAWGALKKKKISSFVIL
jgi:hypothetical protein